MPRGQGLSFRFAKPANAPIINANQQKPHTNTFRIRQGNKRIKLEEQAVEEELEDNDFLDEEPEGSNYNEGESQVSLDKDLEEYPTALSMVAEEGKSDAISVSHTLLDMIETALDDDPIFEFLDHDAQQSASPPTLPAAPSPTEPPTDDFIDDFDELALREEEDDTRQEGRDILTMHPPSRRPSVVDLSEEVPHQRAKSDLSPFVMALGLWCQVAGISRQHYQSLLEVFELLDDLKVLKTLPRSISTIKKWVHAQLPLLKLRKQDVPVMAARMPTQGPKRVEKELSESMHFFDPVHLFTTILSSQSLRSKIHVGMAHFVDRPLELYHSNAWATSIRSCSGEYARNWDNSTIIFPSDSTYYRCGLAECYCAPADTVKYHLGRVFAIGKDFTSTAPIPGAIRFVVNPLKTKSQIVFVNDDFRIRSSRNPATMELFLCDKDFLQLSKGQIMSREKDILFDHKYEGPDSDKKLTVYTHRFVVRNIWDSKTKLTRALQLSAPLCAELEMTSYGRKELVTFSHASSCISVPLLTFIDAFGLYRNMYRAILGIYCTMAGLSWRERKRRANVFALALGPHASRFDDVIKVIEPGLSQLDKGCSVTINGEETLLCVYTMAFTGDMKQQSENSGFGSVLANRGCSKCTITKKQKGDLLFNIVLNARYHYMILNERALAKKSEKGDDYLKGLNIRANETPLIRIAPALDVVRSRPLDAAHSEFAGIAKYAQDCLINGILTPAGAEAFATELRHFQFPPGWGRLQSPTHHLQSYRMQESGRLSVILPALLRTWLRPQWVRTKYLEAVKISICPAVEIGDPVDAIVHCFAAMAKSNTVMLSLSMSSLDRKNMAMLLIRSRRAFQRLHECAVLAESYDFRRGNTPISSQDATPTRSRRQSVDSSKNSETGTSYDDSEFVAELGRAEYDTLARSFSIGGNATANAAKYKSRISIPNVHAGLHYDEVAFDYATPNNVVTFSGEDKHRRFKADILHTNFRDVTKALLHRESIYLTIRLVLAGSYSQSEPSVTTRLQRVHERCPNLLDTLLPYSERQEEDHDESRLSVIADEKHENAVGIACLARAYVRDDLQLPLWPHELPFNDPFYKMLSKAYESEYSERNVTFLRGRGLQWCQKLAFTDRESEHRIIFSMGDFIGVGQQDLARLEDTFAETIKEYKGGGAAGYLS